MNKELLLLAEAARMVGLKPHQLVYAITNGDLAEPQLRLGGKRVFTTEDIKKIQKQLAQRKGEQ